MSTTAIEQMETQYVNLIEQSPDSRQFTLDPDGSATSFYGILEDSYEESNTDGGGVRKMSKSLRIIVSEILTGMKTRGTEVTDGTTTWNITKADNDGEVPTIWLS